MSSKVAALGLAPDIETARRDAQSHIDPSNALEGNASQDIASLAYALWEKRGCPLGSAEQDWNEAEQQLSRSKTQAAGTGR